MNKLCEEFQKIEDEFNEKIEEFQKVYDEVKKEGNVNLGGDKNFFKELERFKHEIIEKSEKLSAKTPEDINAETKIYLGKFEKGNEEIFESLENPLFINGEVDFFKSEKITKIPPNLVFNGKADFSDCTSLTEIPENTVFKGVANFYGCTSLTEISQGTVFSGDADFWGCTSLTEISQNVVFNGNVYFEGCTSLSDKTIEQLKQMKKTGKIKGKLTLPDGDIIF